MCCRQYILHTAPHHIHCFSSRDSSVKRGYHLGWLSMVSVGVSRRSVNSSWRGSSTSHSATPMTRLKALISFPTFRESKTETCYSLTKSSLPHCHLVYTVRGFNFNTTTFTLFQRSHDHMSWGKCTCDGVHKVLPHAEMLEHEPWLILPYSI